jgi:predicted transposase YdaD
MKYDIAAKVVIENGKEAILRKFLKMDPDSIEIIEQLPEETTSLRTSDFPLLVTLKDGQKTIVLIEVQTEFDRDFPLRLLEYSVRFILKYHLEVIPFVLVLKKTDLATGIYENKILAFKYGVFRFWEEEPINFLDEMSLYPFLPLMNHGEDLLEEIDRKINDNNEISLEEKSDLMTSMAIFAGFKSRDLAMQIIKRRRDIMMESPTFEILKELLGEDYLEKGLQQGLQQGLQKGLQQGIQQGYRKSLLDVLEFKFKTIPEKLLKTINDITDADTLSKLHHYAMECDSITEFKERMLGVLVEKLKTEN